MTKLGPLSIWALLSELPRSRPNPFPDAVPGCQTRVTAVCQELRRVARKDRVPVASALDRDRAPVSHDRHTLLRTVSERTASGAATHVAGTIAGERAGGRAMVTAIALPKPMTYEEYAALPEDGRRYEL